MSVALSFPGLEIDAIRLARLLRRQSLERLTLGLKIGCFVCLMLFLFLLIYKALDLYLTANQIQDKLKIEIAAIQGPGPNLEPIKRENSSEAEMSQIESRNLFDNLGPRTQPQANNPKPANNTTLVLIGTFVSDGKAPYAIIEDQKKQEQDVFMLNESIFNDATLKAIFPDKVEIERNGRSELLVLDDMPSSSSAEGGAVSSDGQDSFVVEEGELDKALENLPLLLTQARAVPYFKDGKSVGLRLFAIRSGSLFEKIGLLNGDILKSLNGNSLADFSQAMSLFQKLKEERSISLVLERNNQERSFRYDIR